MPKRKRIELEASSKHAPSLADVAEQLEILMPRCLVLITLSMLWDKNLDWIGSEEEVRLAVDLVADRQPDDPVCIGLSALVHSRFHSLAHRSWFSMTPGLDLLCVRCVDWYADNDMGWDFSTASKEAASAMLLELSKRDWPAVPHPSKVAQCADLQLLRELSSRSIAERIKIKSCSIEFLQTFFRRMDFSRFQFDLKKYPDMVKRVVDRHDNGALFRDLYSNDEMHVHFGIAWALHNNLAYKRSPEVVAYFKHDRSRFENHRTHHLKHPDLLELLVDLKRASRSEIQSLMEMASRRDCPNPHQVFQLVCKLKVPQPLLENCSVDFLVQLEPRHIPDANLLLRLAKRGVPLHQMQDRDALAMIALAEPNVAWPLITAMDLQGKFLKLALDCGVQVKLTPWEVRRMGRLFPDRLGALLKGLDLVKQAPLAMTLLAESKQHPVSAPDVLGRWLAGGDWYADKYWRCVQQCNLGSVPDMDGLEFRHQQHIRRYALWRSPLNVVRALWPKLHSSHLWLALQNPHPDVHQLAICRAGNINTAMVIRDLIDQHDVGGLTYALSVLPYNSEVISCADYAADQQVFMASYAIKQLFTT